MSTTAVVRILRKERETYRLKDEPLVTEMSKITGNPFKVLISCILSLRTRDSVTAAASERLYQLADTPEEMLKVKGKIAKIIYPVGFYKTKAKYIEGICKDLIEKYDGKVPQTIEELLTFKGVGRKTANIVMVYGFSKPGIPVDIHVHIVANRLGWVTAKTPEQTEVELRKMLPKRYWLDINDLFVLHGQNVCLTRKPRCTVCPVKKYCKYYQENKNLIIKTKK